jgi:hypothetical protein
MARDDFGRTDYGSWNRDPRYERRPERGWDRDPEWYAVESMPGGYPDRERGPRTEGRWAERYGRDVGIEDQIRRGEAPPHLRNAGYRSGAGYETPGAPDLSAYGYGLRGPVPGGYGGPGGFTGQQGGFTSVGHRVGYGEGTFAGRGPRNYRRSDDRIREDVCEALARHPAVDASEIEVRVENGEVVLTGTVEDRQMKRFAEDVAEGVSGVTDVRNEVRVQRGARERHTGDAHTSHRDVGHAAAEESPTAGTEVRRATRRSTTEPRTKT